jgi:hypothetical protein
MRYDLLELYLVPSFCWASFTIDRVHSPPKQGARGKNTIQVGLYRTPYEV